MTTQSTHSVARDPETLYAPTGARIIGTADSPTTSELSLEEIDALCERLNFDGHSPDHNAEDALRELAEAVRGLKDFGGAGGTDAEDAAAAALDKAEKFLA